MQESSGTRQEKFSVLMCCKGLLLHRERSPSDPGLDTCTGSPKGARLVPREIDSLKKKRLLPLSASFSPSYPLSLNFCGKEEKNTRINDCLLHWRLMIHWCLSVLALKVEKSFDDGGLRLTDKSWMPPPLPSRCFPSLILLSYVLHCYCYGNPLLFYFIFAMKVQAEGRGAQYEWRLPLALHLFVCLPRLPLSPSRSFSVWFCSSRRMHFCNATACH